MKNTILFFTLFALAAVACNEAQTTANVANLKTESFKVWGNCSMCKKTIEKSLKVEGIAQANWDKSSKQITVAYDSVKINLDQIQRNIAAVGYDNDVYRGDDAAYEQLPDCCKYERKE